MSQDLEGVAGAVVGFAVGSGELVVASDGFVLIGQRWSIARVKNIPR